MVLATVHYPIAGKVAGLAWGVINTTAGTRNKPSLRIAKQEAIYFPDCFTAARK
jgi:hypothetical protein